MKTVLLGDVMADRGYIRGPFGSALRRPEMKNEGIPVYEQQNAIYDHRKFRYFIDEKKYNELKRFTVQPGDLLISCSGTLGKITVVQEDDPIGIISQALLILRPDTKKISSDFLYYFLTSPEGQYLLLGASHGSVQTNIAKREVVSSIKLPDVSVKDQNKIVEQLKTIDEKIELNRRMNETLEKIGQTLFKHYFINNPVAKTWPKVRFSEFTEISTGKGSTKSKLAEGGSYPLYGANGIMGTSDEYLLEEPLIITGRVGSLGNVRAINGKVWLSDNVIYFRPQDRYFGFVYLTAKTFDYKSLNRGSTQPLITQTDLKNQIVRKPDEEVLNEFEEQFSGLLNKIQLNDVESESLTRLRDLLLPRLISGKIKVNDGMQSNI